MNPIPLLLAVVFPLSLMAQVPDTLAHSISPPATFLQTGAQFGGSVATDGVRAVVGAQYDDISAMDGGVAKVFDATTGVLLHVLKASDGLASDFLGSAVAVSGNRVVVGASGRDFGSRTQVGRVLVYDLASATPTLPVHDVRYPSDYSGAQFGRSVALAGARLIVGAPGHQNGGGVFVYDLNGANPTTYTHVLLAPEAAGGAANFGTSVALNGSRIAVGAPNNWVGQEIYAGGAYVYDLTRPEPTEPWLTFADPTPAGTENFGFSVAISSTHVVIGVPGTRVNSVDNAGVAYAYSLANPTVAVPLVPLSSATNARYFGYSAAISGNTVLVGAPTDFSGTGSAGKVHQYNLSSGTPGVAVQGLFTPTPNNQDRFGHAVAISGTRVVIGAPQDDTAASDAGSAYLYRLDSANPWFATATLNDPGPSLEDNFANVLAVSGTWMVVGCQANDTGATNAGNVLIYDLAGPTPSVASLVLPNPAPAADDQFGNDVAISGRRVVVGAVRDDFGAGNAGSAYVYDLRGSTPTVPVITLRNPSPASSDHYGAAVAISGAIVVIGTPEDDTGGTNSGSVYVYDLGSATPSTPIATLANPSPGANEAFGFAVAASGTRVVVGATGETGGGKAYVYELSGATPTVPAFVLANPTPAAGDLFGFTMAISADRVIVGAPSDEEGASNTGKAYVYNLTSETPTVPVVTLNNPSPDSGDGFGFAVAISGTKAVVGANNDDTTGTDAGVAYLYDLAGADPTIPITMLANPTPATNDQFGFAVAIDGATAAVGSPFDDSVLRDKGCAYVFAPSDKDADEDGLLDLWEYAHFGSVATHTALDDTDGDGREELIELAFDTDPHLTDPAAAMSPALEGGFLTITLNKRAGVSYTVESAPDPEQSSFNSATTTILVNTPATLKVRDNVQLGPGVARFLHVKITAAP